MNNDVTYVSSVLGQTLSLHDGQAPRAQGSLHVALVSSGAAQFLQRFTPVTWSHRSNHYQKFSRAAALAAGCGNLLGLVEAGRNNTEEKFIT